LRGIVTQLGGAGTLGHSRTLATGSGPTTYSARQVIRAMSGESALAQTSARVSRARFACYGLGVNSFQ
jgi:hypothetical protein